MNYKQHYGNNRLLNRGGKATHQHMRQSLAAQRIATAYDGVRAVYGNKVIAKTTPPRIKHAPRGGDMNYNKSCGQRSKRTIHRCASCVPTSWRRTRKTNCTAATMNYNYIHHISKYAPIGYAIVRTTGTVEPRSWHNHAPQLRRPVNGNKSRTRPAPICTPRGGHRYKPRPEPRRHHLTHAADMGHTSPQRRHQHKAPCIVPLPGAAAATYGHKPKPPCHVSIYDTKQGGFIFYCDKN